MPGDEHKIMNRAENRARSACHGVIGPGMRGPGGPFMTA